VRFRALLRHGRGQLPASPVTLAADSDDWCAEHFLVGTALRGVEETGNVPVLIPMSRLQYRSGDLSSALFETSPLQINAIPVRYMAERSEKPDVSRFVLALLEICARSDAAEVLGRRFGRRSFASLKRQGPQPTVCRIFKGHKGCR
jgi:hypothetical protein